MTRPSSEDFDGLTFDDMTEHALSDFSGIILILTSRFQYVDGLALQHRACFISESKTLPSNSPILSEYIRKIKIFNEASAVTKEQIAEIKTHRAAFEKGIAERRYDLNVLGHYVHDDGKIYMAMNNKYNSKYTMTMKQIHPKDFEALFKENIKWCEKIMPRTAERMKTWDTDLAKTASGDKKTW